MSDDQLQDVASGDFHRDRTSRLFLIIAVIAVLIGIFTSLFFVLFPPHVHEYDPLGPYPSPQLVGHKRYHVTDKIDVTARKCAKVDGTSIRGTSFWVEANNSATTISVTLGVAATRYRSCGPTSTDNAFHFLNPVPSVIADIVRANGPSTWFLTGTETPFRPATGELGIPRTWRTETFVLVP